jgi:hypothetical protein
MIKLQNLHCSIEEKRTYILLSKKLGFFQNFDPEKIKSIFFILTYDKKVHCSLCNNDHRYVILITKLKKHLLGYKSVFEFLNYIY